LSRRAADSMTLPVKERLFKIVTKTANGGGVQGPNVLNKPFYSHNLLLTYSIYLCDNVHNGVQMYVVTIGGQKCVTYKLKLNVRRNRLCKLIYNYN